MSAISVIGVEQAPSVSTAAPALSLRRNFSWTLLGNVIYAGCQWAMLVVLAKLGTARMVGQFALGMAIVLPLFRLAHLEMRSVLCTDAKREFAFGHYLAVRIATAILALAAIPAVVYFGHYSRTTGMVILAVALTKTFDFMSDVFYGLLQRHERLDRIAISLMIQSTLQLTALALVVFLTRSVLPAVLAMAVISASVLLAYDLRSARLVLGLGSRRRSRAPALGETLRALRPHWEARMLRQLVWLGLPLGVVTGLNNLTTSVPRYMLASNHGENALGIFAAIFALANTGTMVMGAIGDAAAPRLATWFAAGKHAAFWSLLLKLTGISILTGAAGLLLALGKGPQILAVLYRPEYARHSQTFTWLMAASGPSYAAGVLGLAVTAMRRFHVQVPFRCIYLAVTAVLCLYLVPKYGPEGAGKAIFLSAIFSVLSMVLLVFTCARQAVPRWNRE